MGVVWAYPSSLLTCFSGCGSEEEEHQAKADHCCYPCSRGSGYSSSHSYSIGSIHTQRLWIQLTIGFTLILFLILFDYAM